MSQNFVACDRGEAFLMPPALTDWVPEDHLVWTVLGAVDQMDLAPFYGAYRANGQGRAAYDPAIVRHQLVRSGASPDDPALAGYWAERRRKAPPLLIDRASLRLLKQQDGRCPLCRARLLPADDPPQSPREWEQWLATTRKTITKEHIVARDEDTSDENEPRLVHAHCHRRHVAAAGKGLATSARP